MHNTKLIATLLVATLGVASVASAQPRDYPSNPGRGGPQPQLQQRDGPGAGPGPAQRGVQDRGRPERGPDRGPGAGPDRTFYRGDRLPPDYRSRQYVVQDWRSHRLPAPARGQQWVQVGADYVLVAVATGVIVSVLLGR